MSDALPEEGAGNNEIKEYLRSHTRPLEATRGPIGGFVGSVVIACACVVCLGGDRRAHTLTTNVNFKAFVSKKLQ